MKGLASNRVRAASSTTPETPSAQGDPSVSSGSGRSRSRSRSHSDDEPDGHVLPAGWPLIALFAGFPLWWAFGLSTFIFIILAVPMAAVLIRRTRLRAPRGFGVWLLFLAWMLAGVTMLFVDAPGAEPGGGGAGRLMVFGLRAAMYLSATVIMLYVLNQRQRDLPTDRVVGLLGFMFVVTTFGGLLGVVAPNFEFTSPMEFLLPGAIAENEYVKGMIHPAAASVQSVLGYEQSRPTAPFSFSNSWGANLSLYLPFFLLSWFGRNAGWRRLVAPFVLLAAVVPTVYSLNRALWIALGLGVVYLAIRLAMLGRILLLQVMAGGAVFAAFAFFLSPLAGIFVERLEAPHSNDRRLQLAFETIRSVATGSPILGYGSTRDVQGNFASVAGGATPDCPACAVPPLGTQGLLWMVVFSTGLVGFALFCAFFVRRFFAHWTDPSPLAIAVTCTLLFFAIELPFYDTLGAPMVTVMIGLGLLARRELATETGSTVRSAS